MLLYYKKLLFNFNSFIHLEINIFLKKKKIKLYYRLEDCRKSQIIYSYIQNFQSELIKKSVHMIPRGSYRYRIFFSTECPKDKSAIFNLKDLFP